MLIKFLLHGKQISLTSDNTTITSNNFNVDKYGHMTCRSGSFTGAEMLYYYNNDFVAKQTAGLNTYNNDKALVYYINRSTQFPSFIIYSTSNEDGSNSTRIFDCRTANTSDYKIITASGTYVGEVTVSGILTAVELWTSAIVPANGVIGGTILVGGNMHIDGNVSANAYNQNSQEKLKENIYRLNSFAKGKSVTRQGIDIIKSADICEYNFKGQEHKQIGVVIGKEYNTPTEILAEDKKGVDLYSMISILWKAVQEQQEQIEQLQKEIKELKGEK